MEWDTRCKEAAKIQCGKLLKENTIPDRTWSSAKLFVYKTIGICLWQSKICQIYNFRCDQHAHMLFSEKKDLKYFKQLTLKLHEAMPPIIKMLLIASYCQNLMQRAVNIALLKNFILKKHCWKAWSIFNFLS